MTASLHSLDHANPSLRIRMVRADKANEEAKARCSQITEANALRLQHGIRTKQELMNALKNLKNSIEGGSCSYMHDYKLMLEKFLADVECPSFEVDQ